MRNCQSLQAGNAPKEKTATGDVKMSEQKSRGFVDLYEEPSEHEHGYQKKDGQGYCYCECGKTMGIKELWEEYVENQTRIKRLERELIGQDWLTDKAVEETKSLRERIKALEGVVEAVRNFLELDMELDGMETFGKTSSKLSQSVNEAKRNLLEAFSQLEEV